jgi:hypothetical protein
MASIDHYNYLKELGGLDFYEDMVEFNKRAFFSFVKSG